MFPSCINELIDCFKKFPGIGQKSAERMVFSFINDFDDFDIRQYYEGPNSDTLQTLGSYFKEAASNYNATY